MQIVTVLSSQTVLKWWGENPEKAPNSARQLRSLGHWWSLVRCLVTRPRNCSTQFFIFYENRIVFCQSLVCFTINKSLSDRVFALRIGNSILEDYNSLTYPRSIDNRMPVVHISYVKSNSYTINFYVKCWWLLFLALKTSLFWPSHVIIPKCSEGAGGEGPLV